VPTDSPALGSTGTSSTGNTVLIALATGQFLMALDSTVMNVSIATVAVDVGATVTDIQAAVTLYTLVMASFMIVGGKVGAILGRKRAFMIGAGVYASGSLVTALAQNLPTLLIGWSLLEGLGAALILPSIVALIASNFAASDRPRAYGLVASAGAIAVAVGPIVGGLCTTYFSWRWVFVGEVVLVGVVVLLARRIADTPGVATGRLDLVGMVLSVVALASVVFGILRFGSWGLVRPKPGAPEWFGLSPSIVLILGGGLLGWAFLQWEHRVVERGGEPLIDPTILHVPQLRSGLTAFFFQFGLQSGLFFAMPLFLSVALGLSAIGTGVRVMPLSITLLLAAAGTPRLFPNTSPRRLVQAGFLLLFGSLVMLMGALEVGTGAEIVTVPLLLAGLGIGVLASQLGAITVSSVPDERAGEVGGLQNTVTNLGASIGTALSGALIVASLTSTFLGGLAANPDVPAAIADAAAVEVSSGVPFLSDEQLRTLLEARGIETSVVDAFVAENERARLDGLRTALAVLAGAALIALFTSRRLPDIPPGRQVAAAPRAASSFRSSRRVP
jgi:MFS family permease